MPKVRMAATLNFRLPPEWRARIDHMAGTRGLSYGDLARRMIEAALFRRESSCGDTHFFTDRGFGLRCNDCGRPETDERIINARDDG